MATDSISFICSACGIKLTVPSKFAGVTGPCPSCNALIQAPTAPPPVQPASVDEKTTRQDVVAAHNPTAPPPTTPPQQQAPYPTQVAVTHPSPPASSYQNPPYQNPAYQNPAYQASAQQTPRTLAPAQATGNYQAPVQVQPLEPQQPTVKQTLAPEFADYANPPQQIASHQSANPSPGNEPPPIVLPVDRPPSSDFRPRATSESSPSSNPHVLRPEPRQLPSRLNHGEGFTKPLPEPAEGSSGSNPLPRDPRSGSGLIRILRALIFVLCVLGVVFGVIGIKKFLSAESIPKAPPKSPPANTTNTSSSGKPFADLVRPVLVENSAPETAQDEPVLTTALPVPDANLPAISENTMELGAGLEPISPGAAAMEVLEKFLNAKTLTERLPLIETQTHEAELANSCLAGPLPGTSRIQIDSQETNPAEQLVDTFHSVDFDDADRPINPQVILVRTRGSSGPKVVVDPFLDSFGGRLLAYAKTPTDKPGYFQVIVSALAICNEEHIPNREKKLTLKLIPQDNSKEIAKAYFGRQSKIHEFLESGTYDLSYGKAKACTVMLQWNTEEDPEKPYLEALGIKAFDWNP